MVMEAIAFVELGTSRPVDEYFIFEKIASFTNVSCRNVFTVYLSATE